MRVKGCGATSLKLSHLLLKVYRLKVGGRSIGRGVDLLLQGGQGKVETSWCCNSHWVRPARFASRGPPRNEPTGPPRQPPTLRPPGPQAATRTHSVDVEAKRGELLQVPGPRLCRVVGHKDEALALQFGRGEHWLECQNRRLELSHSSHHMHGVAGPSADAQTRPRGQ